MTTGGPPGADNPTMHASIGWDWIPTVRGRNFGITDDVYIDYCGPVLITDPFVRTVLPLPDTTRADVLVETVLENRSEGRVEGVLKGRFGDVSFEKKTVLAPGEKKQLTVRVLKEDCPDPPRTHIEGFNVKGKMIKP